MILFVLAYLGAALTIVRPCILPVLPSVFARADRSFFISALPMLASMALTFAAVATLAAFDGGWVVPANEYSRLATLALMALFGVTLLFPSLADRLTRPLVAVGARMSQTRDLAEQSYGKVIVDSSWHCHRTTLGTLRWSRLRLDPDRAALQGASVHTTLLLAAYAGGGATSLALALVVGGRVFAAMKRSLHAGEWIRRGLGAAVLVGVAIIIFGLDTSLLTQVSLAGTTKLEQELLDRLSRRNTVTGNKAAAVNPPTEASALRAEDLLPAYSGATGWLNSQPLMPEVLKGHVVLVDFWAYSCINCLRAIPYVRSWA